MQCPRTNEQSNMMQFPQEMMNHIADFMAHDLRASDPRCYRAARTLQARWRGYVQRHPPNRCLCRYVDRSFWGEVQGSNVCPACAAVWEHTADYWCACTDGDDCSCGNPSGWDDFDLLESPREGPSPLHWSS